MTVREISIAITFFCIGGLLFETVKWLTYDLMKALARATYYAVKRVLFGKLKTGHRRIPAIIKAFFPILRQNAKAHLKWEWINGATIGRDL